jgi:ADP-heptose:LPS heptosyltransferase
MFPNPLLNAMIAGLDRLLPSRSFREDGEFQLPRHALVITPKYIGDNILLTPLVNNLYLNLPEDGAVDVVTAENLLPLYHRVPAVRAAYADGHWGLPQAVSFLKEQAYDTVFFCRYSLFWAVAAWRAGIPQRIGFDLERLGSQKLRHWGRLLTHSIRSTALGDPRNQREIYLDMLGHVGLEVFDDGPVCSLQPIDWLRPRRLLDRLPPHPRIVVHAGSGSPGKKWPLAAWGKLLRMLHRAEPSVFITVGSRQERATSEALRRDAPIVNLCGETTIPETIALLSQVDLVITLDTAIAHMATLAGTPNVVVLYGPTQQAKWRPWTHPDTRLEQLYIAALPCRPCVARTCLHRSCMAKLTPEMVFLTARRCLVQRKARASGRVAPPSSSPPLISNDARSPVASVPRAAFLRTPSQNGAKAR